MRVIGSMYLSRTPRNAFTGHDQECTVTLLKLISNPGADGEAEYYEVLLTLPDGSLKHILCYRLLPNAKWIV